MSARTLRTPAGGTPPEIEIRTSAGTVTVEAVEGSEELDVRVEALDNTAEQLLDRVDIDAAPTDPDLSGFPGRLRIAVPNRLLGRTPAFAVTVRTPAGARARVAAATADVQIRGRMGRLELTGASGDVDVEECAELQLRSASGDVRIGSITGRATVASASGDLRVGSVGGGLEMRTASGDVTVGETSGDVSVGSASGDVRIDAAGGGSVHAKTVSGDVSVAVRPGLRVWLDLSSVSGRMDSELDDDAGAATEGPAQLSLALRSVSGDLGVRRAAAAPTA
jgi:hypothetical protein